MPINYKRYPRDWKTRILPAIHARADHRCEECKVEQYATVWSLKVKAHRKGKTVYRRVWLMIDPKLPLNQCKPVRVVLTVAHLDHDETNHKVPLERLKLLCQRCHLRYDSLPKARKRKKPTCTLFPECTTVQCEFPGRC